jgi:hypothetical protein
MTSLMIGNEPLVLWWRAAIPTEKKRHLQFFHITPHGELPIFYAEKWTLSHKMSSPLPSGPKLS